MRIALIGHGAMGRLVESQAKLAGDQIGAMLTSRDLASNTIEGMAAAIESHDVAIDFSAGNAVARNVEACVRAGVPLVEGTTGWKADETEVLRVVREHGGSLVYGANFSIGVNIFYKLVIEASKLMGQLDQYEAFLEEQHHSRKRDVPSGTALKLKELMAAHLKADIPVASTRAGHIPGTHRVGFDSAADQITLTHTARSRAGFAAGALLAARWIIGRKGVYEFANVIDEILNNEASV